MNGLKQLIVYLYNENTGGYIGTELADESPLEPNVYLLPANATQIEPPPVEYGKWRRWNGVEWVFENLEETPITTAEPTPPTAQDMRNRRNNLLSESDWTQFPDVPASVVSQGEAWRTYRQALRDVPQQGGFPTNINWPIKP
jgi:hypothetical protein